MELLFETERTSNLAFGTTQRRPLLPHQIPPTRTGNEIGPLRGAPHRGPGCYNNEEVSGFVHEIKNRIVSGMGYSLGARTESRLPRENRFKTPAASAYQTKWSQPRRFKHAATAFNCAAGRFPPLRAHTAADPGAGTYEHHVSTNRRVGFHGSFGGVQVLKTPVTMKCSNENFDRCGSCKSRPVGDYFQYFKEILCKNCYGFHLQSGEKYPKNYLMAFQKVRDCSGYHKHDGTDAQIKLMSEKDFKKQSVREAYLSLYHS